MPKTPDRSPGESDEEGIVLENWAAGNDPPLAGGIRYVNGAFRLRHAAGLHTPHSHAAEHYVGGVQPAIVQNMSSGAAAAGKLMQANGTGGWNLVDIVSGVPAELNQAEDLVLSTTVSSTPQLKLRMTTTSVPLGDYILFWSYTAIGSNNNTQMNTRVRKNSTTDLSSIANRAATAGAQFSNSGFAVQFNLSGVNTYDLDYWLGSGAGSAGVQSARFALWLIDN